ncbi:hypothetical protein [Halostagnicola kamekurae]|uniref:Uncharacterized protein n=1 Tax=Halostagnicola kamekurae TaxID=619731 RepID=A0A1I6Q886_9EURY|nr:hypothetical protein [Halostagnicola kamekurae]SFS48545.1 hypothetical protein SAMN04488556_1051 [Halostagnicola kamekurae]
MGGILGQVQENYSDYVDQYPERRMFSTSGPTGLPLNDSILTGSGHVYDANVGELEREYLFSENPSLPAIEELPFDVLQKLPVQLTNILRVQITSDHRRYWNLTYEILDSVQNRLPMITRDMWFESRMLFNLALSTKHSVDRSHSSEVLNNTAYVASYVAYPVLEGYVKSRSGDVIERDGTVKKEGEIWSHKNGEYYKSDTTCSSLTDLLVYFEESIVDDHHESNLNRFREEVAKFVDGDKEHAYGLLYRWRNTQLHGQGEADVQYGIVLNLLCYFLWIDVIDQMDR